MQREIIFRGICKDKDTINFNKFVYGNLVKIESKYFSIEVLGEDSFIWNEVIPETVGQYTGLKDKNGKEIYDGDVIQFNNNEADICQVCYGEFPVYDMETEEATDTACGWYAKVIFTDGLSKLEPFCYDRVINTQWIGTLNIEVIGNIHQNPELLKGGGQE